MSEQTTAREERTERLRRLRAREAARKVHTTRGPLMERPLLDQISFVLFDPGALTPRGDNYQEPLWRWQARAIAYLLDEPTPQLSNTPVPTQQAAEIDRLRARVAALELAEGLACAAEADAKARLCAELDSYKDHLGHMERHTLPNLRREIQHHQDGKKRWRDRAEKAEAKLPPRFSASPAEVDHYLRQILAEDTLLDYQRAIGNRAVEEAAKDIRMETARLKADGVLEFDKDWAAASAADHIDPLKGGGHYPSVLLCGQHNGFGPCPGAPRCTPRDAETEVA